MDLKAWNAWAFHIKSNIKNSSGDEKRALVEKLMYDIRGEQTPGRFFEKLTIRIVDYNKRFNANISIPKVEEVWGDKFYYVKSAVLAGLINSVSEKKDFSNTD